MIHLFIRFSLLVSLAISAQAWSKTHSFKVYQKCTAGVKSVCTIYKNIDGVDDGILEDARSPTLTKVNDQFYHVTSSCGSPCQFHLFLSRTDDDNTDEFIAIDKRNNCLIESQSYGKKKEKDRIYARKLLSKKRKMIANMNDKAYREVNTDMFVYNLFQADSYFDKNGTLHLISDTGDKDIEDKPIMFKKLIKNPCGS